MSCHVRDTAPVRTVSGSCLLSRNVGKWVVSAFSLGREPASVSPYLRINPVTGHVMDVDPQDAPAVYRAMGSDHADPPDEPPQIPRWQFDVPDRNPGGPPPGRRGGGQLPRPPPGGGGGGEGGGGGAFPLPGHAPPHPTEKFLGNVPAVFTGDWTKVDSFLTQWELYCSINANNAAIQNQYQKTMLFLTDIQGDLV